MAAKDTPEKATSTTAATTTDDRADAQRAADERHEQALTVRTAGNPYPAYDEMTTDELRAAATAQGVGVPADVEKAALIGALRKEGLKDNGLTEATGGDAVTVDGPQAAFPSFDLTPLPELRALAEKYDVALPADVERGGLVTQLRAVASGATAAQSAQVGTAAPALDTNATSGGGVEGTGPAIDQG